MAMSKAEALEALSESRKAEHLARMAHTDAVLGTKPDAGTHWTYEGWAYSARLYRSASPTGGYVVLVGRTAGQAPDVHVVWLDDWTQGIPSWEYGAKGAAASFMQVRNGLLKMPVDSVV